MQLGAWLTQPVLGYKYVLFTKILATLLSVHLAYNHESLVIIN